MRSIRVAITLWLNSGIIKLRASSARSVEIVEGASLGLEIVIGRR